MNISLDDCKITDYKKKLDTSFSIPSLNKIENSSLDLLRENFSFLK